MSHRNPSPAITGVGALARQDKYEKRPLEHRARKGRKERALVLT